MTERHDGQQFPLDYAKLEEVVRTTVGHPVQESIEKRRQLFTGKDTLTFYETQARVYNKMAAQYREQAAAWIELAEQCEQHALDYARQAGELKAHQEST